MRLDSIVPKHTGSENENNIIISLLCRSFDISSIQIQFSLCGADAEYSQI